MTTDLAELRRGRHAGLSAVSGAGRDVFFYGEFAGASAGHVGSAFDVLRDSVRVTKRERPFHIDAWVVLPDHMHCVWTLPPDDVDFSNRWKAIKIRFVQKLPATERRSKVRAAKGERGVWQRRFWEHAIRDDRDYANHIDYYHWNPMKHGLVRRVADWPYSSFHRYVGQSLLPEDWAGAEFDGYDEFGERDNVR